MDGGDELVNEFAMRSRGRRKSAEKRRESPSDRVLIERKLKPDDTLAKLSLQYSVAVADLKRANNLVNDQDFVALQSIKIPVSRLRHALSMGLPEASSASSEDDEALYADDRTKLIESRDPSVEDIFTKADASVAMVSGFVHAFVLPALILRWLNGQMQAREHLSETAQIPGSFHFVGARQPDSGSCSVWALVAFVFLLFVALPLVLTFFEEEEASRHASMNSSASHAPHP